MPINLYTRVLDTAALSDGDATGPTDAADYSDYRELEIFVRVIEAGLGDSPALVLEHSSRGEADTYVPFATPVTVSLAATGNAWFHVPAFMRWVAWRLTGTLEGSATVTLDIIAKA